MSQKWTIFDISALNWWLLSVDNLDCAINTTTKVSNLHNNQNYFRAHREHIITMADPPYLEVGKNDTPMWVRSLTGLGDFYAHHNGDVLFSTRVLQDVLCKLKSNKEHLRLYSSKNTDTKSIFWSCMTAFQTICLLKIDHNNTVMQYQKSLVCSTLWSLPDYSWWFTRQWLLPGNIWQMMWYGYTAIHIYIRGCVNPRHC